LAGASVDPKRFRNILDRVLSNELETKRELALHLVKHIAGDAKTARCSERLQTCGDVDSITIQRAVLLDHIAQVYADAIEHLPIVRNRFAVLAQPLLKFSGAPYRFDYALELRKHAVSSRIDDSAAIGYGKLME
jgi:hypothetical protein